MGLMVDIWPPAKSDDSKKKRYKGNRGDYACFRSQKQHPVSNMPWAFFPPALSVFFNFPLTHKSGTSSQVNLSFFISFSIKKWSVSTKYLLSGYIKSSQTLAIC